MPAPTPLFVCVDIIVYSRSKDSILMIRRGNEPFKGRCALPGGYLDSHETVTEATIRELREETHVCAGESDLKFLGQFSDPYRDPRGRTVSLVFYIMRDNQPPVLAGDDAAGVEWRPMERIFKDDLAFDHDYMIRKFFTDILMPRWPNRYELPDPM